MQKQKQQGVAVVTVLWTTLIISGLLAVIGISIVRQFNSAQTAKIRNEMVSLADGVSEQARIYLYDQVKNSSMTAVTFLSNLRTQVNANSYGSTQLTLGSGVKGAWTIKQVSPVTSEYGWVDVHATVVKGTDKQTIVRRVSFGQNDIFELAMLTETVNCMFCHLKVNGDVGTYQLFRPGWGTEGVDGHNSGDTSDINGSLYTAYNRVTTDNTNLSGSTKVINGAKVTGEVNASYTGSKLPQENGVPTFPPIKKSVALANAFGSLSVGSTGRILALPFGTNYTGTNNNKVSGVNQTYNGNVVLIGTATDPIVLNQDVYISGDVVIKGYVKGRGAIYAGRNMYIAGDVRYVNPPDAPGSGVCTGVMDKLACAKKNVQAGKDEARLAARGNIIIGDYTRFKSDGTTRTADDRQSHEFMESQFGFTGNKYFSTITGEEVNCDGSGNNCKDIEGNPVPNANRFSKSGSQATNLQDGYSMAMRPGVVSGSAKTFTPWMSDAQYADDMLTYASDTNRSWRSVFKQGSGANSAQLADLIAAGIPANAANTINTLLKNYQGGNGNVNEGGVLGYYNVSGNTVRFMRDTARSYKKQVNRIDGFLYANQRIGGTVLNKPIEVNGGMIGRQLGVLAAGLERTWWMGNSRYDALKNNTYCKTIAPNSTDCAMTINYDYRLQAGGMGFNLVRGKVGMTAQWKLSGDALDEVAVN